MTADETFAETVARLRSQPSRPERVAPGRTGQRWGNPSGRAFALVVEEPSPVEALALATAGAQVVHDACGCGGEDGCVLDWLSPADVAALAEPPVLRRSRDGLAELQHWRSVDGHDLVVARSEVTWGTRIR